MGTSLGTRLVCLLMLVGAVLQTGDGPVFGGDSASRDPFAELKINRTTADRILEPFDLKGLDGASVRSGDLNGKVVLLNFWATWCGPCKEEMPSLARLQRGFDPQRFAVVTITTDVQPQGIKQFLNHLGITLPVLFDEDQEVSRGLMVRGLPTTVLVASDGRVVGRAVGPRAWDSPESLNLVRHVLDDQK
ncbi:putative Thiol-disulfide oxidoreductase [Nitrospira sp. KM1]|uniref:TlpA family protein disulfide reductase n=1 Tax=Nitrospira sp. KM1 TaxID=1936990 RepID=UPI0013A75D87|nr:TlpA disulfide reductase family protein [Nitrospira sp. KM1]BCA55762.1 putative Thiol-disulfide oxidoreductase [Nitrospira sp. KM1]